MERKHVERVYGIKRVAYEIIRYIVFFSFFFFFADNCNTGESIIIDVIFEIEDLWESSSGIRVYERVLGSMHRLVEEIYGDKIA